VRIPTPEELGVGVPQSASPATPPVDWADTQARLQQLGAVSFQLETLSAGRYRFACWLPGAGGAQRVEAVGASEAEAVRSCLEQAARRQPDARGR
jgi:hypothetical protein